MDHAVCCSHWCITQELWVNGCTNDCAPCREYEAKWWAETPEARKRREVRERRRGGK